MRAVGRRCDGAGRPCCGRRCCCCCAHRAAAAAAGAAAGGGSAAAVAAARPICWANSPCGSAGGRPTRWTTRSRGRSPCSGSLRWPCHMRCSCRGAQPRPPRIISSRAVRPACLVPNCCSSLSLNLSVCLVKHVRAVRGAAAAGAPQARPRATELTSAGCWLPVESTAPARRSSSSREKSTNQARPAARRRLHAAPPEPPPRTMHTRRAPSCVHWMLHGLPWDEIFALKLRVCTENWMAQSNS